MATVPSMQTFSLYRVVSAVDWNSQVRDPARFMNSPPRALVTYTSTQTSSTGVYILCAWDTETYDTDTIHDPATNNSRLTVRSAGLYNIWANVFWAGNATGARVVQVRKNSAGSSTGGTGLMLAEMKTAGSALASNAFVTREVFLAAGDYVETFAYQNSGGNLAVGTTNGGQHSFGVRWVANA